MLEWLHLGWSTGSKALGQEGVEGRTSQGVWCYCWMGTGLQLRTSCWDWGLDPRGCLDVLAAEPSPPAQWAPFLRLFASLSASLLFLIAWLARPLKPLDALLPKRVLQSPPHPCLPHILYQFILSSVLLSIYNNLVTTLFVICVLGNGSRRRQGQCLPSLL